VGSSLVLAGILLAMIVAASVYKNRDMRQVSAEPS
jgi:CHASE3 domain sensor protein